MEAAGTEPTDGPRGEPGTARPGRKRSEVSRKAILGAAIDIVHESGYAALSVEAIAKRAGTGKQTIYRWWPSKADVVMEALSDLAESRLGPLDHGSLAEDMRALMRSNFAIATDPQFRGLLQGLMAEAQLDLQFAERFRTNFLERRRRALGRVFVRARDRGELTPKVPLNVLVDAVLGALWYRVVAIPGPLDEAFAEHLIALVQ